MKHLARIAAFAALLVPIPSYCEMAVRDGIEIHLGLVAAEKLRGYPSDSTEAAMHGGVPKGWGHYHVNISLIDAAKRTAIGNARVEVQVDDPGIGSETKALQPMTINNAPSYGSYFRLLPRKLYWFTVRVRAPGAAAVTEVKFQPRTD